MWLKVIEGYVVLFSFNVKFRQVDDSLFEVLVDLEAFVEDLNGCFVQIEFFVGNGQHDEAVPVEVRLLLHQ